MGYLKIEETYRLYMQARNVGGNFGKVRQVDIHELDRIIRGLEDGEILTVVMPQGNEGDDDA